MMPKTCLVTRPEHDDTTHYLSKWCELAVEYAKNKGMKVLDLNREKAVRDEFEKRVNKLSPDLVILNGHGDEKTVTGHKNIPLLVCGENDDLLKDKIVYSISCKSAKLLGVKSVEKGAKSYSGYDDDFIFFYDPRNITKPINDKTAGLFLEHSNIFVESLIKGNTVSESKEKAGKKLKENMLKCLSTDNHGANLVRFLWWDLKHFVSFGNSSSYL